MLPRNNQIRISARERIDIFEMESVEDIEAHVNARADHPLPLPREHELHPFEDALAQVPMDGFLPLGDPPV